MSKKIGAREELRTLSAKPLMFAAKKALAQRGTKHDNNNSKKRRKNICRKKEDFFF